MPKIKKGINIKTPEEINIMKEGGAKLSAVKSKLMKSISEGVRASDVEELAVSEIKKTGGESSFMKVPGYSWATCVNVNDGIVHGIPHKSIIFKNGDLVSVDVGLFYKGFHTDTSFSVGIDVDKKTKKFMSVGENSLKNAITEAKPGNRVYDLSKAMQDTLKDGGLTPVRSLVGHGVGRSLHEEPQIPCFVYDSREESVELVEGMVLAIEVMYTKGSPKIQTESDGWTISVSNGKISALYEETVAVTSSGPLVLT